MCRTKIDDLDGIISDLIDKYHLSKSQVVAEIEKTFSSMLSRWHQRNVVVVYTTEGSLEAVAYHNTSNGPEQIPIDISSTTRGLNTIKRILDKNLSKSSCFEEVDHCKRKEHEVFWGKIIGRDEKCLSVELQLEFGVTLYATCPLKLIGKHERDFLHLGDIKAFHLRRVDTVLIGDVTRTQITLDRVSKNLVEKLLVNDLQLSLSGMKVVCTKRYVGHKSFVDSNCFLPKKSIEKVSKELGEHIQITVRKNTTSEKYAKNKKKKMAC